MSSDCCANDISFEDAYSMLVNNLIDEKDFIIYLSGSGNSLNLVNALEKRVLMG